MKKVFFTILFFLMCLRVGAETPSALKKAYGAVTVSDDRFFYASGTLATIAASSTFTLDIPQNACSMIANDGLDCTVFVAEINFENGVMLSPVSWKPLFELRNGESLNIPLELPVNTQVSIVSTTGTGTFRYVATGRRNYKNGSISSGWTK